MARIVWRRRGVEWVGRLTAAGPDRFSIARMRLYRGWNLSDLQTGRVGVYDRLMDAKVAAYQMLHE